MKSKEGIINLKPKIKKVTFGSDKMNVWLEDGRNVIVPLKFFPSIQKLLPSQRKKHVISDGEVIILKTAMKCIISSRCWEGTIRTSIGLLPNPNR